MNRSLTIFWLMLGLGFGCTGNATIEWQKNWQCQVFPPEHEITTDSETGAKVVFVTTNSSKDVNLYFDLNCWFNDLSMMVFYSDRFGRNELMGYLPQTGELVRLQNPEDEIAGNVTVDYQSRDIYVVRNNTIYQWQIEMNFSATANARSAVSVKERKIATAPEGTTFFMGLTESADGKYLSTGLSYQNKEEQDILAVNTRKRCSAAGKKSLMFNLTSTMLTCCVFLIRRIACGTSTFANREWRLNFICKNQAN